MSLTEFGKVVRKARIDADETLLSMSNDLGVSPSFLSGMENGRKNISQEWVKKIEDYFEQKGVRVKQLAELAMAANKSVPIDGLPFLQQMMMVGFAKSEFTPEQLKEIMGCLDKIRATETKTKD